MPPPRPLLAAMLATAAAEVYERTDLAMETCESIAAGALSNYPDVARAWAATIIQELDAATGDLERRSEVASEDDHPTPASAAELDAMTPQERRDHFTASIVDPATLTPEQRAAVVQRATPAGTDRDG